MAYQGERGLDREMLEAAERRIAPDPDVLFVVDLSPDEALARIQASRGQADDFEGLESLRRLRDVFLNFDRAVILDGSRSMETLSAQAWRHVEEILR
ncbi:MAG: hypothetical protein AAFZ18_08600 [Myxococcota bacterium]